MPTGPEEIPQLLAPYHWSPMYVVTSIYKLVGNNISMHAVRGSSLFRLRLKVLQGAARSEIQKWLYNTVPPPPLRLCYSVGPVASNQITETTQRSNTIGCRDPCEGPLTNKVAGGALYARRGNGSWLAARAWLDSRSPSNFEDNPKKR